MIYSHKTDTKKRNLSHQEKHKLKQLGSSSSTAWMIDDKCRIN